MCKVAMLMCKVGIGKAYVQLSPQYHQKCTANHAPVNRSQSAHIMVSPFNILIDRSDGHTWMTKFSIHEVEKDDAYDSAVTKLNHSEQN